MVGACGAGRKLLGIAASTVLGVLVLASPTSASVSKPDARATHAYLEAKIAERRAVLASEAPGIQAIEALAGQLQGECPGVLADMPGRAKGEPLSRSASEIVEEVVLSTFGAYELVTHPALARFDQRVRRLRWSNRRLTKLLHSLALEQDEQSGLAIPPLCADLRFWVASGYTQVSAQTKLFQKEITRISSITLIESGPGESPLQGLTDLDALVAHRMKPYESPADRGLARRAFRAERILSSPRLHPFISTSDEVFKALGIPPASVRAPS